MTKIVTATAIMQLHERAVLDVDAPAFEWAPALRRTTWHGNTVSITVRQLMSHTSGLSNPIPIGWVHPVGRPAPDATIFTDRLLQKHNPLKFEPGARTSYSNLGYLALGRVISVASGQTYEDYVREHILHPLGMTATDFEYTPSMRGQTATGYQPRWSVMTPLLRLLLPRGVLGRADGRYVAFQPFYVNGAAYGGLIGSIEDAARFATVHLSGGRVGDTQMLSEASVSEMQRLSHTGPDLDVGLGWFRKRADSRCGATFVKHLGGGAGFFNLMRLYPDRSRAVLLMGNSTSYDQESIVNSALEAARSSQRF